MIRIIEEKDSAQIDALLASRAVGVNAAVTESVQEIIRQVQLRGDEAVADFTRKFDGAAPDALELTWQEREEGAAKADPRLVEALERAAQNIRSYHEEQRQRSYIITRENGAIMGQRVRALRRVGLYVPGGTASYPSSVLMNAIPAKVAGVPELIMTTPPGPDGSIAPHILAAANIAGVDRIFRMGGAQAVAALALGTQTVPRVDKIVGPGNQYVATAKRLLFGTVDIDMIAGPSEILIVCDGSADPRLVAADMMSQAEHDPMASSVVVCVSRQQAEEIEAEVQRQLATLSRREIITRSLEQFGALVVCDSMERALEMANRIAPEHLELMVEEPFRYLGQVENAGSVFLGHHSPEPLGDYFAGPNHVLPTNGTARFFSPLSVDTFLKKSSYLCYTQEALAQASEDIVTLARSEGLDAHANSILVRMERKENP
ncbi:MAG: histidinol dehydrogenase [Eubacteriales bacterium]|jgi:histidinol dehydrogenase